VKEADSYDRSWIKKAEAGHRERMQGLQKSRTVSSVGFGFVHHFTDQNSLISRPCFSEKWNQNFFVPAREFFVCRAKNKKFMRHVFGSSKRENFRVACTEKN